MTKRLKYCVLSQVCRKSVYLDKYAGNPVYLDKYAGNPVYLDKYAGNPVYLDKYAGNPVYLDKYAGNPVYLDKYAGNPVYLDKYAGNPVYLDKYAGNPVYLTRALRRKASCPGIAYSSPQVALMGNPRQRPAVKANRSPLPHAPSPVQLWDIPLYEFKSEWHWRVLKI
ncbi:Involucrin [Frankliniella fusca]|uniref:Involucrin n=1 Tax=Frankliniella fusca TaxID=407009 RepID=A0AAE1LFL2_9NEOP|nr:Involucrin [Frankliniella fusca]